MALDLTKCNCPPPLPPYLDSGSHSAKKGDLTPEFEEGISSLSLKQNIL